MNTSPLNFDEVSRFKTLASQINFDGLDASDVILGKTTLAGMLTNDQALANAPAAINALPFSAPLKKVFSDAFDAARKVPTTLNGTPAPSTNTVAIVAVALGALLGVGIAIYLID